MHLLNICVIHPTKLLRETRRMMKSIIFCFLLCTSQIVASLTILKTTQTIYDKSPKLRIRGSGFEVDDHDIILDLAANGQNKLVVDKDFMVSKDPDGDGLILKLLENRM